MEKVINRFPKKSKDHYIIKSIVPLGISTGLLVFGGVYGVKLVFSYMPFTIDVIALNSLSIFIASIVIFCLMILTVFMLRGSSRLHLVLLEVVTIGYFGAYLSALVLMRDLNIEFDKSNKTEIVKAVIEKRFKSKRRCGLGRLFDNHTCRNYYLYTDDWVNNKKRRKIKVNHGFYEKVVTGESLRIYQKNGLLGFKWVSSVAI